jgi:transposase
MGTWTERVVAVRPRAVMTGRARAEATRRVGKDAPPVAAVARDLGVGWATSMRAVRDHGSPLVDDPARLQGCRARAGRARLLTATPQTSTR